MRQWFINVAITFDGMIALKDKPLDISNDEDWCIVHKFRNEIAAIVVGVNTINIDNPSLLTRSQFLEDNVKINHPIRVILDRRGVISEKAQVLKDQDLAKTYWVTQSDRKIKQIHKLKIEEINIKSIQKMVNTQLTLDKRKGKVMVEGGANTISKFINEGDISFVRIFRNVKPVPNGLRLFDQPPNHPLSIQSVRKIGNGIEEIYRVER